MARDLVTPKELAARLDVASSTLREWSAQFAPVLSATAAPPRDATSGRVGRRCYNPQDVATLARARDLLASGLTFDRTLAALQTEPEPLATQDPRALAASDLGRALLVIADQRDRLDDMERRLADLERDRRPFWQRLWPRS